MKLAIKETMSRPVRFSAACNHTPQQEFEAGKSIKIRIEVDKNLNSINLYYRHVNQGERFNSVKMEKNENSFQAIIEGSYTDSPYSVQYYFELKEKADSASLYPGFNKSFSNQPYFVLDNT